MARQPRIVIPGILHHITHRGNDRQAVFTSDAERHEYLRILGHHSSQYGLSIVGYCLMPNHVHLIAVPRDATAIAGAVGRGHLQYAGYFNRTHSRTGHLWANRYFSCPMDDEHAAVAMRYVEQNPVRAGLARQACEYPWSSARAHIDGTDPSGLLDLSGWSERWEAARRGASCGRGTRPRCRQRIPAARPWLAGRGDDFISEIEATLGRPAKPKERPARAEAGDGAIFVKLENVRSLCRLRHFTARRRTACSSRGGAAPDRLSSPARRRSTRRRPRRTPSASA